MQYCRIGWKRPQPAVHYCLQPIRHCPCGLHQRFDGFVGVESCLRGIILREAVERLGQLVRLSKQLLNKILLFAEEVGRVARFAARAGILDDDREDVGLQDLQQSTCLDPKLGNERFLQDDLASFDLPFVEDT